MGALCCSGERSKKGSKFEAEAVHPPGAAEFPEPDKQQNVRFAEVDETHDTDGGVPSANGTDPANQELFVADASWNGEGQWEEGQWDEGQWQGTPEEIAAWREWGTAPGRKSMSCRSGKLGTGNAGAQASSTLVAHEIVGHADVLHAEEQEFAQIMNKWDGQKTPKRSVKISVVHEADDTFHLDEKRKTVTEAGA
eukprot:gnl/MRDRNA2_/MRDRNA2_57372_c0_seq1.p1 gnl/MRDRNA2_/MRDRNA2_57372_c0~~gnl/MRDRNA2_/MRDRNA2_57372_c0_seq1.p1  ORF type:complete len:195 (+),score=44.84 gnl/MRDRNA2_/MRDRNA2_57372_c0_seq1:53-637(+)